MSAHLNVTASSVVVVVGLLVTGCGGGGGDSPTNSAPPLTPAPPVTPTPAVPPTGPPVVAMPRVIQVQPVSANSSRYGLTEFSVDLDANFTNPFDQRQVSLMARFIGPDNQSMEIPGFWSDSEGSEGWRVRFSAPAAGRWQGQFTVLDSRGQSVATQTSFDVAESTSNGWILPGDQVDPTFSSRYLAYHDGSPFYGKGHGDAFAITSFVRAQNQAQSLINEMNDAGENYIIYWPSFTFSIINSGFDNYDQFIAGVLDEFVERMRINNKHLIYTIWDHSYIRDANHPWGNDRWQRNGFSRLVSVDDFFVDNEAWEWQKNFYRYLIARWSYSTSIGMWQTVSEIDGSSAFQNSNPWHQRVNQYFVENDPYRHPTTASMAGDRTWDAGHAVMDVPQVHIYNDLLNRQDQTQGLVIETAEVIARYTADMWALEAKPNWVGEFGVLNSGGLSNHYPELFHNALWAGLANGAAMTPAEWNDDDRWEIMTPEMRARMRHLASFVENTPLVSWDPQPLTVNATGQAFQAWGLTSDQGSLIWGLDTTHRGRSIEDIRRLRSPRENVQIELSGIASGEYQVFPYNTHTGQNLTSFVVMCDGPEQTCRISLPTFTSDIALRLSPLL